MLNWLTGDNFVIIGLEKNNNSFSIFLSDKPNTFFVYFISNLKSQSA